MASFKAAFAANRKAGKKVFTWEGKRYTTKLATEKKATVAKTPKTAPIPKSGTVPRMLNGMDKSKPKPQQGPQTPSDKEKDRTAVAPRAARPVPKPSSGTVPRMLSGMDKLAPRTSAGAPPKRAAAAAPTKAAPTNDSAGKSESFREKFRRTTGSKVREAMKIKIR